jgi:hypothetical protein
MGSKSTSNQEKEEKGILKYPFLNTAEATSCDHFEPDLK